MSATVIARSVVSTPERSASDTWKVIIGIIVPDPKDPARDELSRVAGVAASVISAEAPKSDSIVVFGGGPRLRIYCLYNDDALTGDKDEDPVRQKVTEDGWRMSLPCEEDDFDWINRELKALSSRVTARKLGAEPPSDPSEESSASSSKANVAIDLKEFFKP